MQALNVSISNFVSVKLSGRSNYNIWKLQMLCLIKSQELLHIIHDKIFRESDKYDNLVRGWIFSTMNEQLLNYFTNTDNLVEYSAKQVWVKLKSVFDQPKTDSDGEGDSWDTYDVYAPAQDLKYVQALNVNVSNFVSVKLSGQNNYNIWKVQMLGLIESQQLLQITKKEHGGGNKINGNYHNLVKGWIFSTMNDQVLKNFCYMSNVTYIWRKLESTFNPQNSDREQDSHSVGFISRTESVRDIPEIKDKDSVKLMKALYDVAIEGCWWKAKSILKTNKKAATQAITTANDNTILHIAVEMGHNYFVEKLLEFIEDEKDIETKNLNGRTALHVAAVVGNTDAAQLLVQKRKELLVNLDSNEMTAFDIAFENKKINTSAYLLKSALESSTDSNGNPKSALVAAILTKEYGEWLCYKW
ncbi:putative ankyrin repeat-containing domain-containing protein [Helianthus anomalus]